MAWYYGTFLCGCEGRVNIIGPTKDREWKREKAFNRMCYECYEKALKEKIKIANEKAKEISKEWELPALEGSEKQRDWANTLRIELSEKTKDIFEKELEMSIKNLNCFSNLERYLVDKRIYLNNIEEKIKIYNELIDTIDYVLENKTEAKFYINNRFRFEYAIIDAYVVKKREEIRLIENKIHKDLIKEGTVTSTNNLYAGIVEIEYSELEVSLKYEKNDTFINLVKKLGYKWENGSWRKKLNETTGSYKDRVAEIGNNLLNKGFSIFILDEDIRNMTINANYEVECKRWVYLKENKLALNWTDKSDLYSLARKITGSKWDNPYVIVDISHFDEIEEFARLYDFKFTKEAREYIKKYKEELLKIPKIKVEKQKESIDKDGLKEILESNRTIIKDLLEED